MITHIVAFAPKPDHAQELADVMSGLHALLPHIDGFNSFAHGPNIDVEGKSPDYPYGFIATYADRAALDRYAADPRHQALGGRLVALSENGFDGLIVMDFETPGPSA